MANVSVSTTGINHEFFKELREIERREQVRQQQLIEAYVQSRQVLIEKYKEPVPVEVSFNINMELLQSVLQELILDVQSLTNGR